MHHLTLRIVATACVVGCAALVPSCHADRPSGIDTAAAPDGVRFMIHLPETLPNPPARGRLVLWFVAGGAEGLDDTDPADGPFLDNPQPIIAADIADLSPGQVVSFPGPLVRTFDVFMGIGPGTWRVQAVLDRVRHNSAWEREPGNLYSQPVAFTFPEAGSPRATIDITLDQIVKTRTLPAVKGVEWFSIRSKLLSEFRGEIVSLNAGVVLPSDYKPARHYPAIYYVPGFGGDHLTASRFAAMQQSSQLPQDLRDLFAGAFTIVLDPESPNGHTLFADSDVNGPAARALIEELIPALEEKYPLIPQPSARIVRGHSSGGWSAVWLPLMYPATFGGGFSSSPDPVDFRAFQEANIYAKNFYFDPSGTPIPSNIRSGTPLTTLRLENLMEQAMAPDNGSAEQWDSWYAVFGPRARPGFPADLFSPSTGKINARIARHWRQYDIGRLLRTDPDHYGPIFESNIRILVGDADQWSLNKAVALVKQQLDELGYDTSPDAGPPGYITIANGYDHGSIFLSPEMAQLTAAMLEALRKAGHIK